MRSVGKHARETSFVETKRLLRLYCACCIYTAALLSSASTGKRSQRMRCLLPSPARNQTRGGPGTRAVTYTRCIGVYFKIYQDVTAHASISWYMIVYTSIYIPVYAGIYQYMVYTGIYIPVYAGIYQVYTSICRWYLYTSICRYITLYTSICRYIPVYTLIYQVRPALRRRSTATTQS
jgi:hypothetical protein